MPQQRINATVCDAHAGVCVVVFIKKKLYKSIRNENCALRMCKIRHIYGLIAAHNSGEECTILRNYINSCGLKKFKAFIFGGYNFWVHIHHAHMHKSALLLMLTVQHAISLSTDVPVEFFACIYPHLIDIYCQRANSRIRQHTAYKRQHVLFTNNTLLHMRTNIRLYVYSVVIKICSIAEAAANNQVSDKSINAEPVSDIHTKVGAVELEIFAKACWLSFKAKML